MKKKYIYIFVILLSLTTSYVKTPGIIIFTSKTIMSDEKNKILFSDDGSSSQTYLQFVKQPKLINRKEVK